MLNGGIHTKQGNERQRKNCNTLFKKCHLSTRHMGGVYCPTCEAGVEVTAKFCLSCGHDLTGQGPITSTGHDLNQLKEVIRIREDLSMAQKFDLIAKIEDGADPIALGIAAAGDDESSGTGAALPPAAAVVAPQLRKASWGHKAAEAAIELATKGTKLADLKSSGSFASEEQAFKDAMDVGRAATLHLLEVSQGAVLPANEALQTIPLMQPPNKSFCPKCGSDIHANAMLQWKKWTDTSTEALTVQIEAAMRASLMHLAASYRDQVQTLKDQLSDAKQQVSQTPAPTASPKNEATEEVKDEAPAKKQAASSGKDAAVTTNAQTKASVNAAPTPKAGGLFGAKKQKKTYDGEPGGKADWFLEEALDTVYDPHGTGKPISAAMIVARSAEGNVRVRDIIRTYAVEGEAGISELAWTSPLTKYLIEAYDAC
jgi:hypothetical protein